MPTQVIMPQLGESVVEGTVSKWFKAEGESIGDMENLLEVETDKVTTDIPSPAGGTLLKILIPEGTTVKAGTILAWVGKPEETVEGESTPPSSEQKPAPVQPQAGSNRPVPGRDRDLGFISPVVARLAKENKVDLRQVTGSGEGGRITKKDVLAYLEQAQKATPPAKPAEEKAAWETPGEGDLFRPTEMMFKDGAPGVQPPPTNGGAKDRAAVPAQPAAADQLVPLTHLRRTIAEHMLSSKHTSPHVTTVMEANLQRVVAHREANKSLFNQDGANLTYTAYFTAAVIAALKTFPLVNSSWSDQGILIHKALNIGLATSLGEEGLIVPVIKNADGLSLLGLARAINDLAARARGHHLQPDEVQGGTFTITNHGTSGSLFATPIINQPQCAILGVGAVQKRVVVIDDAIAIRPMVYLSLTFDHRILDGSSADGFLGKVVEVLENWN